MLSLAALFFLQASSQPSRLDEVLHTPQYAFDSLQRLRSVRQENGATRWIVRDVAGRAHVERTLNLLGVVQGGHIHLNDGLRRIGTTQNAATIRLFYGRSLDELLVQERSGEQLAPIVSQLGSTMKLAAGAGAIADQFRYDAYGGPLAGDTKAFSHLFAGAIYDQKSKLYDLRHRHYDPKIGRFLSRDPLGIHADPVNAGNAYAYVANNPLNRRDPLGLFTEEGFFEWLDRKAGEFVQGVEQGGEMVLSGVWEGLQESKRMFDDAMCFGLSVPPRSAIGKKIEVHKDSGSCLPEALALAAVDSVVETAQGVCAAATTFGSAVVEGDVKTATAVATGVGAGILIPGPDELVTIKTLDAISDARHGARTTSGGGEGPGIAKRCEEKMEIDGSETPGIPERSRRRWREDESPNDPGGSGGSEGPPSFPPGVFPSDEFGDLPRMIQRLIDEGPGAITGLSMVDACELWLTFVSIRTEIGGLYGPFSFTEMYTFTQAIERFHRRRGPFGGAAPGAGGVE